MCIEPIFGRALTVTAKRLQRAAVRGAAQESTVLMGCAVIAARQATRAVFQTRAVSRSRVQPCANVRLGDTQHASKRSNVDILRRRDGAFVRIYVATELRHHRVSGDAVHSHELSHHTDDRFERIEPTAIEHVAQPRAQCALIERQDWQG